MAKIHNYKHRIYYQDTDAGGVTYHARYANFAERARCEFLRENGKSVITLEKQDGIILVVRKLNLEYLQPAYLDEEITIKSFITEIGGASFIMQQDFYRDNDKLVSAKLVLVAVANKNGNFKPNPIPPSLKDILTHYHHKDVV